VSFVAFQGVSSIATRCQAAAAGVYKMENIDVPACAFGGCKKESVEKFSMHSECCLFTPLSSRHPEFNRSD